MEKRKRQKDRTWEIRCLRPSPAAFIGLVDAPDEAKAKELAIKQFHIRPADQKRLIALWHQ